MSEVVNSTIARVNCGRSDVAVIDRLNNTTRVFAIKGPSASCDAQFVRWSGCVRYKFSCAVQLSHVLWPPIFVHILCARCKSSPFISLSNFISPSISFSAIEYHIHVWPEGTVSVKRETRSQLHRLESE